jgi:esterase/lipase superfamily enzyme
MEELEEIGDANRGPLTDMLTNSTEFDAYAFWYQTRDIKKMPKSIPTLMNVAGVLITIVAIVYLVYSLMHFDSPFFHCHLVVTSIFCAWLIVKRFDGNRKEFLGFGPGGTESLTFMPTVESVWLGIIFAVVEAVLIFVQCTRYCVCQGLINCCEHHLWRVRGGVKSGDHRRLNYRPLSGFAFIRRDFWYLGDRNEEGLPDGFGKWYDESFHGECLEGFWEAGEPCGPFRSRETGTNALFEQGAIGYVASRADCQPTQLEKGGCFFEKSEQRYGLTMVECSIAGGFFPFLPRISYEWEMDSLGDMIADVQTQMLRMRKLDDDHHHQHGEHPRIDHEWEAVVFVHGWASDMATALTKLSLMSSLGKVPTHFIPIVFGWGCGNVPAFFYVKNHSMEYAEDFIKLFKGLGKFCKKVHVIGHSMGCQVWCANAPQIMEQCFLPCERVRGRKSVSPGDQRLQLASVILSNAEVLVEEFAQAAPKMLDYAERITLYIDSSDIACLASQIVQSILPYSKQQWRNPHLGIKRTMVLGRQVSSYHLDVRKSDLTGWRLQGDAIDRVMPEAYQQQQPGPDDEVIPVHGRIDVIDCTNLEANAGFSRHNYWGLNTLMAEDVVSCMTSRKSAKHRAHLVRRKGSIYDFLSPPSTMTA